MGSLIARHFNRKQLRLLEGVAIGNNRFLACLA